ncbi:hypothetical protein BDV36DRAFT_278749 [Aspergillus pseudocaelatus]|uniref:Transposase n=1 Tax=Aspergillus pseudocaelatus TaxID=1825620 RepID=A0ABQ6W455_9EURO|nr:hypothetical protein BDV36DRAFT_278749 [Aspergillus pseudocaelatus]
MNYKYNTNWYHSLFLTIDNNRIRYIPSSWKQDRIRNIIPRLSPGMRNTASASMEDYVMVDYSDNSPGNGGILTRVIWLCLQPRK